MNCTLKKDNIMAQLNKDEQKILETIKATPYMTKTIALAEDFVAKNNGNYLAVFDEVFRILNEAKNAVDKYLKDRKNKSEI